MLKIELILNREADQWPLDNESLNEIDAEEDELGYLDREKEIHKEIKATMKDIANILSHHLKKLESLRFVIRYIIPL